VKATIVLILVGFLTHASLVLADPADRRGAVPAVIVEEITGKIQEKIDADFERVLERRLRRMPPEMAVDRPDRANPSGSRVPTET
jgi:hypothetical protein